jgi:hypothetical protein
MRLGDFSEPACMLNVTAAHLVDVLRTLPELDEAALSDLADDALYELLDVAIYRDDARTAERVIADSKKYSKFDFLTNGGESFDHFKSFIEVSNGQVRILFSELSGHPVAARVDRATFVATVSAFLSWIEREAQNVGQKFT